MSFIYLINEYGTDNYKIGLTKSTNISRRKKNLQTGNSNELHIVKLFETEYPSKLEKLLHSRFYNKRGIGEWFVLTDEDIFEFIPLCEKLNENIKFLLENNCFYK